jgi:hypothetical protein
MNASLIAVLSDAERLLVTQTEAAELATLDEDAAIEFEARIRRARNKYISQYPVPGTFVESQARVTLALSRI